MSQSLRVIGVLLVAIAFLAGCATRPINPPSAEYDPDKSYRIERPSDSTEDNATLVVLAFSGGGTRAAAFSYGVLETLRDMEVQTRSGRHIRALDTVDVITGISGGSFTALAFGLYGDKLFDVYEAAFLKRDVQGELVARALNPFNWLALGSTGWGRSELAADMYDEILFKGATFKDLRRRAAHSRQRNGSRRRHAAHLQSRELRRAVHGSVEHPPGSRGRGLVGGAGRAVVDNRRQPRRHLRL